MKYSEMNEHQKKAFRNIKWAARDLIGGLENTLTDRTEDSDDYISANEMLNNHEELINEVYERCISGYYDEGFVAYNSSYKMYLNDIKFCGKEWLMEQCRARIIKEGY